jgi:radical SAM superfamily enzyme YgiQ (UPF0313 family)
MKISLLSLPSTFAIEPAMNPSLGLCYISSFLKKYGNHDIDGIDLSFYGSNYLDHIPIDSEIYLIYCMTPQFNYLYRVADYISIYNNSAKILAGGPHPTALPMETSELTEVSMPVVGEGEGILNSYINKNTTSFNHLDELPFPDREVFGLSNYKRKIHSDKAVHIVTLRGCHFICAFCDKKSVGTKVRYRSIQNVMDEVDYIIDKYGIRALVIYDDIFTLRKGRVYNFCDEFKKRNIKWRCWSRSDTINYPMLKYMKSSGLVSITMGIESGSDIILKNIKKGVTAEQNKEALTICKELNVPVRCSIMYGNPGETKDTLKETIKLIETTQPDEWNLAVLVPIPGSDIWSNPESYGLRFDKYLMKRTHYASTDRFGDTGVGHISISLDSMTDEELRNNLPWFVKSLERVCPRKKIQDTIQEINIK